MFTSRFRSRAKRVLTNLMTKLLHTVESIFLFTSSCRLFPASIIANINPTGTMAEFLGEFFAEVGQASLDGEMKLQ